MTKLLRQASRAIERAQKSALRKLAKTASTAAVKSIRNTYTIRAGEFKKKTRTTVHTGPRDPYAIFRVKGGAMKLTAFQVRQTRRGASVRIRKDKGRKLIRSAFIATMPSGHRNVFVRKTKKRTPLKGLYSTGPANMFRAEGEKAFTAAIAENGEKVIRHEVERVIGKIGTAK